MPSNEQLLIELYSNRSTFNTFKEIYTAIDLGIPVYWKNEGYSLIKDKHGYLVRFKGNGHCVGLHEPSYKPEDFFSGTKELQP